MGKIRLGSHVKDIINGRTGTAYERVIWLFGCDHIVVLPDVGADKKEIEIGYVMGMLHHILYAPDNVIYLYLMNFILVGADMTLYYKYKHDAKVRADLAKAELPANVVPEEIPVEVE